MIAHALVDSLVVTAEDDEVSTQRHFVGYLLVEGLAIRRYIDDVIVVTLCLQGSDASVYWFALHHHSGASSVWIVVHSFPFI